MNKILKLGTVFVLGCIWVSTAAYAADSSAPVEKEKPAEVVEVKEKAVAPVIKELPAVPTIKEIAEKEQAKE